MSDAIRIHDLAQPELSDAQRGALAYGDTLRIELSRDSILQEAREATGLDDFGPTDFHERLDLLCDEWGSDSDLVNLGRLSLRNKLVQHARSRLLIQDVLTRHPEIHAVEIKAPIIVAGLPRSGTTHLLNLMAADSRLRALPLWESYEPVPLPGEAPLDSGFDPRYQRCEDTWQMMQSLSPLLAAMHPMNPDHIHEELKTVLKILTWQDGDTSGASTRWVLKCPQHLEQLPVLQSVFADATFAVTHRDPVSVVQSAATMLAYGQRISRKHVDVRGLIQYWTDRVVHLLQACVLDRASLPDERSIDVPFQEFMADDLAMVARIYAKADLPMTAQSSAELQTFIDEHPRGKHGSIVYNLREDFGVEPSALRARFDFYFDRFPVAVEVE